MNLLTIWKAFLELFRFEWNTSFIFRLYCVKIRLANVKEERWGSSDIVRTVISKSKSIPIEDPYPLSDAEIEIKSTFPMSTDFPHNFPCFQFNKKGGDIPTRIIIYFHGGAFVHQPGPPHWQLVRKLCVNLNSRVFFPVYPKAPYYNYKASLKYVMSTTEEIINNVPEGTEFIIMGDSAGGNIAIVITTMLRDRSMPLPSQVVLISPWTDLTLSTPELELQNKEDPWLNIPGIREAARMWAGDESLNTPLISPVYGNLSKLPPVSMFIGSRELFFYDQKRFYEKLRQTGNTGGYLFEVPGMIHCYGILPIPEAEVAWSEIVKLLNQN